MPKPTHDPPAGDDAAFAALAAGRFAGFDALVNRHRGRLFGFLWHETGDAQRAEDLLQETFLKAVSAARSGLGPRRPDATAWLFTIARHLVIDERRRRSARPLRIVGDARTLDPRRHAPADDTAAAGSDRPRSAAWPRAPRSGGHAQASPAARTRCPMPARFARDAEKGSLLDAVLHRFFRGEVPAGEPVRSDAAAAGSDVEVFNYAVDATSHWARIWVLRDSKLPIRVHLPEPDSDAFYLLSFDYSDPQPAAFFDAGAFRAAEEDRRVDEPHEAYGLLQEPVAGTKPRGSAQLNEVIGGYAPPVVRRVRHRSGHPGQVMVVTDRPKHRLPGGGTPSQMFVNVTDRFGNVYLPTTRGERMRGDPGQDFRWYFEAISPVKTGDVDAVLSGEFELSELHGEDAHARPVLMSFTRTAEAPRPGDPAGDFGGKPFQAFGFEERLRSFLAPFEHAERLRAHLAAEPDDRAAQGEYMDLLRSFGREEEAWAYFEGQARDALLAAGGLAIVNDLNHPLMAQYLLRLRSLGRKAEHARYLRLAEAALAEAEPRLREMSSAEGLPYALDPGKALLPQVVALEETVPWTRANPPRVEEAARGRDGLVAVRLSIPPYPAGWDEHRHGSDGTVGFDWYWQPAVAGGVLRHRVVDLEEQTLWLLVEPEGAFTLQAEAVLARDNRISSQAAPEYPVTVPWEATVPAAEPATDSALRWLAAKTGRVDVAPPPRTPEAVVAPANAVQAELLAIAKADAAGDAAGALAAVERLRVAAAEAWPDFYAEPVNADARERALARQRAVAVRSLCALGRDEEAEAELEDWAEEVFPLPEPEDWRPTDFATRSAFFAAAADLLRADPRPSPEKLAKIDELMAQRVPTARFPEGMRVVRTEWPGGWSESGYWPRRDHDNLWRPLDTLRWDLLEPRANPR